MHILLALLGTTVTILVLLYRLADSGIDLGGINPFAWRRRRAWRRRYEANPVFSLGDPREIAAVLLTGTAKIDGDLSGAEKRALLAEFENTFSMSPKQASELLSSSVYLLGDLGVVSSQLDELLDRYREHLETGQIDSLVGMLDRVAAIDGGPSPQQRELIERIRHSLLPQDGPRGTWA